MTRALLTTILLSVVGHAAFALGKISVELLCEGKWRVELRKSQLNDGLGRQMQQASPSKETVLILRACFTLTSPNHL